MSRPCTDRMIFAVRATPAGKFVDDLISEAFERNDPRCKTALKGGGSVIEQIWAALHHADEVEQREQHLAADLQIHKWKDKFGGDLSGSVTVGGQITPVGEPVHVDQDTKTINTTAAIPRDMMPHIGAVMNERDRLSQAHANAEPEVAEFSKKFDEHMAQNPDAPKWPTLHAIMLPLAIENVRKRIKSQQEA